MTWLVSTTPLAKSSKCRVIERCSTIAFVVGLDDSPIQSMTQSIRNTANVIMPATIWFFVRLDTNRPAEMKHPPISSRPM